MQHDQYRKYFNIKWSICFRNREKSVAANATTSNNAVAAQIDLGNVTEERPAQETPLAATAITPNNKCRGNSNGYWRRYRRRCGCYHDNIS
jgi:hypothetical protein